jgi:hypothetical protein
MPSSIRTAAVAAWVAMLSCGALHAQALPDRWSARAHEGGTLYEPSDLPPGSVFNLWAPPAVAVGAASGRQAYERVKREGMRGLDAARTGPRCEDAVVSAQGSVTQSCRIESGGKPPLHLQFVMLPVRDGQAHWLRITAAGDPALLERYKKDFNVILEAEIRREVATRSEAAAKRPERNAKPRANDAAAREKAIAQAIRAEPGKGVKPSDVETVLFSWAQVYRVTGLIYEETIYLLFKDGRAYEGLELAPEDFDVEAARRLQPRHWVAWRKSGKTYSIRRADSAEWKTLQAWPAIPGRRDERLAKTFTNHWYASSGGFGGAASTSSIRFSSDGRFEQFGRSSYGTGVLQSNNGFSAGSTTTTSKAGTSTSTTVSGGATNSTESPAIAGGTSRQRNDGARNAGRYRIDGWTIELHRDNGEVERLLFLFPHADRSSVNIGGVDYKKMN